MDIFLFWMVVAIIFLLLLMIVCIYFARGWGYPEKTEIRDGKTGRMGDRGVGQIHLRIVYLERRVNELEQEIEELKKKLGEQ